MDFRKVVCSKYVDTHAHQYLRHHQSIPPQSTEKALNHPVSDPITEDDHDQIWVGILEIKPRDYLVEVRQFSCNGGLFALAEH